jgi:alpha-D-xyloside xylohydrolase
MAAPLPTRLLERRELRRTCVQRAEVVRAEADGLELATIAPSFVRRPGAPTGTLAPVEPGPEVAGRLRLDLPTDGILRVRYAEGDRVPENDTPMVVGRFPGATRVEADVRPDRVLCTTAELRVVVALDPMRIEVETLEGRRVCGIGGLEKNHFRVWDAFNTGIVRGLEDDRPVAVECFDLRPREAIYGFGETFIKLDKVGQTIDLDVEEGFGTTTPRSYKNVPFFMSTCGYGVFFNHSCRMTAWLGSLSAPDLQVAAEDAFLDYWVIAGDLKRVLSRYTDITGKGRVPPRWSFGYWQSKISYRSAEETLDVARKLREAQVPCDVIHLDTFWFKEDWYCDLELDAERFPDPRGYFAELGRMGFKVSLWQLPYVPEGSDYFRELASVDGFVKDRDGEIYDTRICLTPGFEGVVGCIDFTNPEAVRVYQARLRRLFELGARVIKVDFGESAPIDGIYHDGTPGEQAHNLYPLLYNRAVSEVTEQATGDAVIWARSAWAGSQRYPLHWGGDSSPNWANLIPQLEGGLSFGLSGFQFWSQDIGGFAGLTYDELLIRWLQAGMFLSHARIHGVGRRELFDFEPETLRICREYLRLRYRLLPYIIGSAESCVERSLPMARALVIEFQDDPTVWNLGDEFLFGDSLLVAPIADPSGRRDVYLPAGGWVDWWTHERVEGPRWIRVEADLATLPLWIREGGIVPLGPVMNYVDEVPTREIALRIAPWSGDGESEFRVPVNDERVAVRYVALAGAHSVEIGPTSVEFRLDEPVAELGAQRAFTPPRLVFRQRAAAAPPRQVVSRLSSRWAPRVRVGIGTPCGHEPRHGPLQPVQTSARLSRRA